MSTENFRDIEEIYHAAVELSAEERRSFLEESCAGDPVMIAEVESLIEYDGNDDFLLSSPEELVAEFIDQIGVRPNLVGTTVGHFEIVELLGKGGMGEVYLATDTKLRRKVSLKFLPPELVANTERMERFIREARAVSALNHPNIITIYDINEVAGKHFIATEYIEGKTLREHASGRRLNSVEALEIAIQIASALDEAHSARIAHRDIKPDNVMIRPNGLVKILDFGIAKVTTETDPMSVESDEKTAPGMTRSGIIVGTAEYMSPEQARAADIDTRTDIFSFGIVLYEMLEGHRPFGGATVHESIRAILDKEPVEPQTDSPEIRRIFEKCLKKDREERYQTTAELLADLRLARRSVDSRNARETTETSVVEINAPARVAVTTASTSVPIWRSRKLISVSAALLVVAAMIAGYAYFWREEPSVRSVAVMPFVNESGNPDLEYLSDGMTESLIRRLSNVPNLSVKARSSVFTYKTKPTDASTVGRELNVDAVLLGRLAKAGNDLNLRLELVNSATGNVIWTDFYERSLSELATVQGEIAANIAEKLRLRLTEVQRDRITRGSTVNSEAQRLYLKGRFHWNKRNVKDFQRSIAYFEEAIAADPKHALAYSGLADALALMPLYGDFAPREYMPKAKNAALKALEIDPNLAEAHASLGYIFNAFDYDWEEAERQYRVAIDLNPGYATARQWYAEHLAFRGRTDEALAEISVALELDPLSLVINRMKGNILTFAGRFDEATAQFERAIEMYPENALLRFNVGDLLAARGRHDEAAREYLSALKIDGYDEKLRQQLQSSFDQNGIQGFWRTYREQTQAVYSAIAASNPEAYFDFESLAFAHAQNGDRENTLKFLRRAYEVRNSSMLTIGQTQAYDFLRNDPEFVSIMRDVGIVSDGARTGR